MRIGFFIPGLTTAGGAEVLCASQAGWLRDAGDDVHIVTFAYDRDRYGARLQGVSVQEVPKYTWHDAFKWPGKFAKLKRRGARAIGRFAGLDAVVAHNFPCSATLGAARLDVRKIWYCNEPPRDLHPRLTNPTQSRRIETAPAQPADLQSEPWRRELDRLLNDHSGAARARYDLEHVPALDLVIANSRFTAHNVQAIYGRPAGDVIYPMVRFPDGGSSRSGLDRRGTGVLVHSRLELVKNIDTVVRGFSRFQATHRDAHLHVVGEGAARAALETLAAQSLPADAFTFHGYLPDQELRRVYEACDVFALLPLDEPFGMVFPEAAARGLLLIGPDHGGPREILDDGRLGWCIDAFSPDALAQALSQASSLSDAEAGRRRTLADQACRARFAAEVIGPQLRRAIAGVLA